MPWVKRIGWCRGSLSIRPAQRIPIRRFAAEDVRAIAELDTHVKRTETGLGKDVDSKAREPATTQRSNQAILCGLACTERQNRSAWPQKRQETR